MTCAMVGEAKCHRHMWGWLQEVVQSSRGPRDFEGGSGGTQLGHRGSEFPEAIVWSNSAKASSWPGHANLGTNKLQVWWGLCFLYSLIKQQPCFVSAEFKQKLRNKQKRSLSSSWNGQYFYKLHKTAVSRVLNKIHQTWGDPYLITLVSITLLLLETQ